MSKETEGRLTRKVLRDDVHDALLQMLLRGRFAPGESLSIDHVARQLGVSPTPVREALVELEHTGLVTRAALRGFRRGRLRQRGAELRVSGRAVRLRTGSR